MCGIVGLFAKSTEVEARLGVHLAAMLAQMDERGPDSAGVAVYREPAPLGASKLTLYSVDDDFHGLDGADIREVRGSVGSQYETLEVTGR
jgi:glutamate synthase domain-containing protein 1